MHDCIEISRSKKEQDFASQIYWFYTYRTIFYLLSSLPFADSTYFNSAGAVVYSIIAHRFIDGEQNSLLGNS